MYLSYAPVARRCRFVTPDTRAVLPGVQPGQVRNAGEIGQTLLVLQPALSRLALDQLHALAVAKHLDAVHQPVPVAVRPHLQ